MGPLRGYRLIEIEALGPGPFCGMMLSDMGAEIIRVQRPRSSEPPPGTGSKRDVLLRGRPAVSIDLKKPEGAALVLDLVSKADGLFEGFRPGVMERLGLGPDVCLERNPRLIYGRVTGWGQTGPLSARAGHDINFIGLSGVLHSIGRSGEKPVPPLNLVGDYGGGGLMLAFGMVCALLEAGRWGKGQVVDAAMVEGSSILMSAIHSWMAMGQWRDERGKNLVDSGAPHYEVYETLDGKFMAVGPVEQQFYELLVQHAGLDRARFSDRSNQDEWPRLKDELAQVFRQKTRAQWSEIFEGTDACVTPVLSMTEAPRHSHNMARASFLHLDGVTQPAPAPRFSRSQPEIRSHQEVADPASCLEAWGISRDIQAELRSADVLGIPIDPT